MKRIMVLALLMMIFFLSTNIFAQIPRMINYQGILLESDEQPVAEGDYKLTFNLYDDVGTMLWTEEHPKVLVVDGIFHVLLGTINHIGLPFDKPYFLGIQVGNEPELTPRMMMTSACYSFKAEDANTVAGIEVSSIPQPNKLLPLDSNGKLPSSVLPAGGPSGNYIKKNEADSSNGIDSNPMLVVTNRGAGDVIKSEGINGRAMVGRSENNDGLVGWTNASDKSGVFGSSSIGIGVTGRSDAISGQGVVGRSIGAEGKGIYGDAIGMDGIGVFGRSTHGRGLEGRTSSTNEWVSSIYGKNVGAGDGVYGWSQSRHGTVGVTSSQNTEHAGVYGTNNGAGPAMKADGDLVVTGEYRGNIGPNNGAPFPKPAYDSGWVGIAQGEVKTLTHNIGGNVDNYVVDFQLHSNQYGFGINNRSYGGDDLDTGQTVIYDGAWFMRLTNQSIDVNRNHFDRRAEKVRVRIWVYK